MKRSTIIINIEEKSIENDALPLCSIDLIIDSDEYQYCKMQWLYNNYDTLTITSYTSDFGTLD